MNQKLQLVNIIELYSLKTNKESKALIFPVVINKINLIQTTNIIYKLLTSYSSNQIFLKIPKKTEIKTYQGFREGVTFTLIYLQNETVKFSYDYA